MDRYTALPVRRKRATNARWEASGPQSHIHISVLPDKRSWHAQPLGGSGILGRDALLHARRLEYKKMQRPFPPARGSMGRGAWAERMPCWHVSGTLRGDCPDRLALRGTVRLHCSSLLDVL